MFDWLLSWKTFNWCPDCETHPIRNLKIAIPDNNDPLCLLTCRFSNSLAKRKLLFAPHILWLPEDTSYRFWLLKWKSICVKVCINVLMNLFWYLIYTHAHKSYGCYVFHWWLYGVNRLLLHVFKHIKESRNSTPIRALTFSESEKLDL